MDFIAGGADQCAGDWSINSFSRMNSTSDSNCGIFNQKFRCEECNKSYERLTSLRNHQKYECGKEKQFSCVHCGRSFHHKGSLKRHLIAIHPEFIFQK